MKVKINTRLECAPAAEGKTLVVKRSMRSFVRFQQATGLKMQEIQEQVKAADVLGVPLAAFFALANAGFDPDWDELLDCDPDAFDPIPEPVDERGEVTPDPHQLPADSSPAADGDAASRPDQA